MKDEALKLALEAFGSDIWHKQMGAITAVSEALAQPEQEPCDMGDICIGCSPRNADGSCPSAQPEQGSMLLIQSHREGYWCADLTCKKCYGADFRFKHTPPKENT